MPMREDIAAARLFNTEFGYGFGLASIAVIASAEMPIGANWPPVVLVDPAATVTILLPPEADVKNKLYIIKSNGDSGAEVLTIEEDSSTTAIVVLQRGESAVLFCDGTSWHVVDKFTGANTTGTIGGVKRVKVALTATTGTSGGGILSWANPEGAAIIVTGFYIDVTTGSTGAATADFGIAANGTTTNDTLIDGTNMQTTGVADNITQKGTNGVSRKKMTSSQFITGTASATLAGLVGSAYIEYHLA